MSLAVGFMSKDEKLREQIEDVRDAFELKTGIRFEKKSLMHAFVKQLEEGNQLLAKEIFLALLETHELRKQCMEKEEEKN